VVERRLNPEERGEGGKGGGGRKRGITLSIITILTLWGKGGRKEEPKKERTPCGFHRLTSGSSVYLLIPQKRGKGEDRGKGADPVPGALFV